MNATVLLVFQFCACWLRCSGFEVLRQLVRQLERSPNGLVLPGDEMYSKVLKQVNSLDNSNDLPFQLDSLVGTWYVWFHDFRLDRSTSLASLVESRSTGSRNLPVEVLTLISRFHRFDKIMQVGKCEMSVLFNVQSLEHIYLFCMEGTYRETGLAPPRFITHYLSSRIDTWDPFVKEEGLRQLAEIGGVDVAQASLDPLPSPGWIDIKHFTEDGQVLVVENNEGFTTVMTKIMATAGGAN